MMRIELKTLISKIVGKNTDKIRDLPIQVHGDDIQSGSQMATEIYRDIWKETMAHERWYGVMRSRVAWAPATIALAFMSFSIINFGQFVLPYIAFVVVLATIFVTNVYLERLQRGCRNICKECMDKIHRILETGKCNSFVSYKNIRDDVDARVGIWQHDPPTYALSVFLVVLGVIPPLILMSEFKDLAETNPQIITDDCFEAGSIYTERENSTDS